MLGAEGKGEPDGHDTGKGDANREAMAAASPQRAGCVRRSGLQAPEHSQEVGAHLGSVACDGKSAFSPPTESLWQP